MIFLRIDWQNFVHFKQCRQLGYSSNHSNFVFFTYRTGHNVRTITYKTAKYAAFWVTFSCIPVPTYPRFPLGLPLSSCFVCHPTLPFSREVNKKLICCRQNALSIIQSHECNTISNIYDFNSYASLVWPEVRCTCIMFYTGTFVNSFVRSSASNLWSLYFENEWTDFNTNGTTLPPGQGHATVDLGVRRSNVKVIIYVKISDNIAEGMPRLHIWKQFVFWLNILCQQQFKETSLEVLRDRYSPTPYH